MDERIQNPDPGITPEFNDAAAPIPPTSPAQPQARESRPDLVLRPPRLMGPGLGGMEARAAWHPPENEAERPAPAANPTPRSHTERFNQEARKGIFRAMFNRKARERDHNLDPDR